MQLSEVGILASRKRLVGRWYWVFLLSFVVAALGGALALSSGEGGAPLFFAVTAFFVVISSYLAFILTSFANDLWLAGFRSKNGRFLPILFPSVLYLFYAFGTDSFTWGGLGKISLFVVLPFLVSQMGNRKSGVVWSDWFAIALIWLPFDFGLLKDVWLWPHGSGAYVFNTAIAVCLAIFIFSAQRRLPQIGYRLQWRRGNIWLLLSLFLGFCAVGIPFGLLTGFLHFNPKGDFIKACFMPFGIFLFIALPEELLFRGLTQNFLSQKFKSEWMGLIVASVLFGATHLNNGPEPDWRYFVLATAAGIAYGTAYMRTKNLFVGAVMHAVVDSLWMQFLMKGTP